MLDIIRMVCDVNQFMAQPLTEAELAVLLEAVRLAPSTANTQPWEIVVVVAQAAKTVLAEATLDPFLRDDPAARQSWLAGAAAVLVIACETRRARARAGEAGERVFALLDIGGAMQNLRLAAAQIGIGTAVVKEFDAGRVAAAVGLPRWVRPVALVACGRPAAAVTAGPALAVEEFTYRERYGQGG